MLGRRQRPVIITYGLAIGAVNIMHPIRDVFGIRRDSPVVAEVVQHPEYLAPIAQRLEDAIWLGFVPLVQCVYVGDDQFCECVYCISGPRRGRPWFWRV